MTLGRVLAAAAAAITFVFISQTASAQYPPPEGSLTCQLGQSRVDPNSNVYFTVTLVDTYGNAKQGQRVNFGITAGSASLSNSFGITDWSGQTNTTIFVGANYGRIEVSATAQSVACRAIIDPIPPTPTPTPPARTPTPVTVVVRQATPVIQVLGASVAGSAVGSSVITPPQTGDGGLQDSSSGNDNIALYLIGAAELFAVLAWVVAGKLPVPSKEK